MSASLVGSEMCIRDRPRSAGRLPPDMMFAMGLAAAAVAPTPFCGPPCEAKAKVRVQCTSNYSKWLCQARSGTPASAGLNRISARTNTTPRKSASAVRP
eukprot:14882954-Alexandrium_andersonii.AAC.1